MFHLVETIRPSNLLLFKALMPIYNYLTYFRRDKLWKNNIDKQDFREENNEAKTPRILLWDS